MNIPILFEDGEALVINKPAGLSIDRPRKGGMALEDHFEDLKLGFQRPPAAVHRLDTDTSGCLLLARNPKALKRFSKAFEDRKVIKRYLGIVAGELADAEGTIELALAKISSADKGWRMIAAKKGKPSITHWRQIAMHGGNTLIEFRPETGRTHQIRVHAAAGLGKALLGDPIYSEMPSSEESGEPQTGRHNGRTMLHAAALIVPREGKPDISATAPLPADFIRLGFADG